MVKAKVFIYNKKFDGLPKEGDLIIKEKNLPPIKDGEFLAEAVYVSVDPYMRAYAASIPVGSVYIGSQVAKILESKNKDYPVGRYVVGYFGWRSHTVHEEHPKHLRISQHPFLSPMCQAFLCHTLLISLECQAYFGFLDICQPKKGETVVVSGAAGAVGNVVGQIANIKGCKVIGIAGSKEKGKWLVDELGFDHFINYKTDDIDKSLSQVAPNGVDCYFDNVGGETTTTVLQHMNEYGRISLCGSISSYNKKDGTVPIPLFFLVVKQIKAEGFVFYRWLDRYMEGVQQNLQWLQEGKLKSRETVTEGFENTVRAFVEMLQGKNFGKAVVKV